MKGISITLFKNLHMLVNFNQALLNSWSKHANCIVLVMYHMNVFMSPVISNLLNLFSEVELLFGITDNILDEFSELGDRKSNDILDKQHSVVKFRALSKIKLNFCDIFDLFPVSLGEVLLTHGAEACVQFLLELVES